MDYLIFTNHSLLLHDSCQTFGEIELRKSEDGLGFNIRGGRDAEYVKEDNGIFVTKIRDRGTAAEVRSDKSSGYCFVFPYDIPQRFLSPLKLINWKLIS